MKPKITIGRHSGFCFGVKRAYDLACACPVRNKDDVYILGKLVHNEDVCADLRKRGIKEAKSIADIDEGAVIFTAHGVGPELYQLANKKGLKIIDATCPKVMKSQRLVKNYAEKKYKVIIFGDKKHKEVKSIQEWSGNKATTVVSLAELKNLKLNKSKRYCLVSQTTQNVEEFKKIIAYLKKNLKNFVYFNTICPSTDDRQKEVRIFAKTNDIVIVIGGQDSANSKMLYEIAKRMNPQTYFIENAKQLKKSWFNDIKSIAISAGASTPEWIIDDVVSEIKKSFIHKDSLRSV